MNSSIFEQRSRFAMIGALMVIISLSVAAFSFVIGLLVKEALGIDI